MSFWYLNLFLRSSLISKLHLAKGLDTEKMFPQEPFALVCMVLGVLRKWEKGGRSGSNILFTHPLL